MYFSCEVIRDRKTGDSLQYAFVEFEDKDACEKAYFKMGLIIAHEGIIIDNKDIIHASQEFGKTVQMNFLDYYFADNKARFDGVVFFSFHPLES